MVLKFFTSNLCKIPALQSSARDAHALTSVAGTKSQVKPPSTQKAALHPQEQQLAPSQLFPRANAPKRGSRHQQSKHSHGAGQTKSTPPPPANTPLSKGPAPKLPLAPSWPPEAAQLCRCLHMGSQPAKTGLRSFRSSS